MKVFLPVTICLKDCQPLWHLGLVYVMKPDHLVLSHRPECKSEVLSWLDQIGTATSVVPLTLE